jgi:2',5'-phosphodiesterase
VGGVKRQTTLETCSHIFVPEEADLDKEVTLLITPYRVGHDKDLLHYSHNGNGCEQAYRFQKRVEPLPENTLLRIRSRWLEETARTPERQANDAQSLRVLTYNILANQNVFQSNQMPFYPYVPQEILSKDRRMPLIVQEILSYRADVICLQEVDESVFYRLMEPLLTARQFNYQGYYTGKSSEGTREGCALFWSLDKFLPVPEEDLKSFAIQDLLIRDYGSDDLCWAESMRDLKALLERRPDLHRVFTTNLGQVVQMVPLTIRPRVKSAAASCSDARPIWIANTHLFFHPQASHIRLLQMFLLARQLGYELQQKPGDTVLCGDFNSSLQNAAGKLMLDRSVPANFRNNKTHLNTYRWDSSPAHDHQNAPNDDFPAVSLPDSFPLLHSAVDPAPAFTHFVDGFQGTLDHILVSKRLRCSQSAPMPSVKDVTVATAMPSANLPSDHVSLVCDLTTIDGS